LPLGDLNAWPDRKLLWSASVHNPITPLKSVSLGDEKVGIDKSYPNPFFDQTTIYYRLDSPQKVEVRIYNSLGQLTNTLANGAMDTGSYSVIWDGNNDSGASLPKGIYFVKIVGEKDQMVKKVIKY
jgi:flagellar hook assembly protein FlgD